MNKLKYNEELLVLALSLGFRGYKDEKDKVWLVTKFKGQPMPFELDPSKEDLFCGKSELVLKIVDERLGLDLDDNNLTKRSEELRKALSDKNHKFWDKVKNA